MTMRKLITLLVVLLHLVLVSGAAEATPVSADDISIVMSIDCDNYDAATGAHEPVLSMWDVGPLVQYGDYWFEYVVYDLAGNFIGSAEFGMTSAGYHDSWVSKGTTPVPDTLYVELYKNGELYRTDSAVCVEQPAPPPEVITRTVIVTEIVYIYVPIRHGAIDPQYGAPL